MHLHIETPSQALYLGWDIVCSIAMGVRQSIFAFTDAARQGPKNYPWCASNFALKVKKHYGVDVQPTSPVNSLIILILKGAVESLTKELAWLVPGIKTLIVEPGIFCTKVMRNIHHVQARVPF